MATTFDRLHDYLYHDNQLSKEEVAKPREDILKEPTGEYWCLKCEKLVGSNKYCPDCKSLCF